MYIFIYYILIKNVLILIILSLIDLLLKFIYVKKSKMKKPKTKHQDFTLPLIEQKHKNSFQLSKSNSKRAKQLTNDSNLNTKRK